MTESSFKQEIETFFVDYSALWNGQEYSRLADLWDHDDAQPFYRAMEMESYLTSWKQLERYWNPGVNVIDGLWNIYTNLVPKQITPDVAVVMFELEWDIKAAGRTQPMSGTDPGMAVLKRKPEGWRMCAYVEACMHPAAYVRKFCEQQVRPTFLKTLEEFGKARVKDKEAGDVAAKYWSVTPTDKAGK